MSHGWDGEGGCEDGWSQGQTRSSSNQASDPAGAEFCSSRHYDHSSGPSTHGVNTKAGKPRLFSGNLFSQGIYLNAGLQADRMSETSETTVQIIFNPFYYFDQSLQL